MIKAVAVLWIHTFFTLALASEVQPAQLSRLLVQDVLENGLQMVSIPLTMLEVVLSSTLLLLLLCW